MRHPTPENPDPDGSSATSGRRENATTGALPDRVRAAAAQALEGTDPNAFPGLVRRVEEASLLAMARTLRDSGLFRSGTGHTGTEIAEATGTAGRHRWILRRWLLALRREGLLDRETGGGRRYVGLRWVARGELREAVRDLDTAGAGLGYPPELRAFYQRALGNLPGLLRDEVTPQALLFADGRSAADGAYRDNWVNRYVNAAVAEVARWVAGRVPAGSPVRTLEIGAGVGGSTADVLDALAGTPVDYLFTDVSRYFLDTGRSRFGHRPGVRFGTLDVNSEPLGAGVAEPGVWDLVIAANVLHNARDIGRCLRGARDLLAPGGFLLCVDTCRELSQILTSMQFLMSPRPGWPRPGEADLRAGTDRIFLTREQWTAQLRAAGLAPVLTAPEPDHPLDAVSVTLFAAQRPAAT
ncbi:class I SAM-dependent methyltransferase [Halostreptopolyspora alba]